MRLSIGDVRVWLGLDGADTHSRRLIQGDPVFLVLVIANLFAQPLFGSGPGRRIQRLHRAGRREFGVNDFTPQLRFPDEQLARAAW